MLRDIVATQRTTFRPQRHGFRFSNTNIPWRFMGATGHALCGGMAYGSLDYYVHDIPIPGDTSAPAFGTPLNDYILNRQIEAHRFMLRTLPLKTLQSAETQFHHAISLNHDFGRVVRLIDDNKPVPILMASLANPLSTRSHWTVVIGYEIDEAPPQYGGRQCGRLILYDSNYPIAVCHITPNRALQCFDHDDGAQFRTYIPDTEYRPIDPRKHPLAQERRAPAGPESWPQF